MSIIGIILLLIGVGAADSANILIPATMVFIGLTLIKAADRRDHNGRETNR